ncbi:hypothetical protein AAY473_008676 [Plecturocebus cupreus]
MSCFFETTKMRFHHVGQAGLELLTSESSTAPNFAIGEQQTGPKRRRELASVLCSTLGRRLHGESREVGQGLENTSTSTAQHRSSRELFRLKRQSDRNKGAKQTHTPNDRGAQKMTFQASVSDSEAKRSSSAPDETLLTRANEKCHPSQWAAAIFKRLLEARYVYKRNVQQIP